MNARGDDTPLYLTCRHHIDYKSTPFWYTDRPMGKNTLGSILSEAAKILPTSCDRRVNGNKVSNHSARKTSISTLLNNNVHPLHVAQLSGHKRLESLAAYHAALDDQQFAMSRVGGGHGQQRGACSKRQLQPASSLRNQLDFITKDLEKQLSEAWDPVAAPPPSLFSGAHLNNCKIEVNITYNNNTNSSPPAKKRRRVFIDDSEE